MKKHGEAFVGIDTAKARNAVAVAESGRGGEIRYLGEFDNTPDAVIKLVRKMADRYETVHFLLRGGSDRVWVVSADPVTRPRNAPLWHRR